MITLGQRYILYWLSTVDPCIRGKIFAMAGVLPVEDSTDEEIYEYRKSIIFNLPSNEELIEYMSYILDTMPLHTTCRGDYHTYMYRIPHIVTLGKTKLNLCVIYNDGILDIIYSNIYNCNGILKYISFVTHGINSKVYERISDIMYSMDLDIKDTIVYFSKKHDDWNKNYCNIISVNYVRKMTIKYVNSVLNSLSLYMKILYLLHSLDVLDLIDIYDYIDTIKLNTNTYKSLYNKAIEYINNVE